MCDDPNKDDRLSVPGSPELYEKRLGDDGPRDRALPRDPAAPGRITKPRRSAPSEGLRGGEKDPLGAAAMILEPVCGAPLRTGPKLISVHHRVQVATHGRRVFPERWTTPPPRCPHGGRARDLAARRFDVRPLPSQPRPAATRKRRFPEPRASRDGREPVAAVAALYDVELGRGFARDTDRFVGREAPSRAGSAESAARGHRQRDRSLPPAWSRVEPRTRTLVPLARSSLRVPARSGGRTSPPSYPSARPRSARHDGSDPVQIPRSLRAGSSRRTWCFVDTQPAIAAVRDVTLGGARAPENASRRPLSTAARAA